MMNLIAERSILPAVNRVKDFEKLIHSTAQTIIVLDSHISQISSLIQMGKRKKKHIFLHADLIQGLKSDASGAEFICQNIRPAGIISTRSSVLEIAKKRGYVTVLRIFLLDSRSVETGYHLMEQINPDMVEVLPGLVPGMIRAIREKFGKPVIAGGLIRTHEEVEQAFHSGASAISTSNQSLWPFFNG